LVIKRLPDPILAVDGDGKSNVQIAHGIFYVHRFVLERKLRRVHTDDYRVARGRAEFHITDIEKAGIDLVQRTEGRAAISSM
jgi:hypothetical protein